MDKIIELLVNKGLYSQVDYCADDLPLFEQYFGLKPRGSFKTYCPHCNDSSVFEITDFERRQSSSRIPLTMPIVGKTEDIKYIVSTNEEKIRIYQWNIYTVFAVCALDHTQLTFVLLITETQIIKIGQFPSYADLEKPELKKYAKLLGSEFVNLRKAIGLVSHGVGIGSFVYLRRIIEKLVCEVFCEHTEQLSIPEEDFFKLRFDEKINIVSDYLPRFLVENKKIYGIVSKGIHELNEEDCINSFDIIEKSIELILDERLAEQEKAEKMKSLSKELNELATTI